LSWFDEASAFSILPLVIELVVLAIALGSVLAKAPPRERKPQSSIRP